MRIGEGMDGADVLARDDLRRALTMPAFRSRIEAFMRDATRFRAAGRAWPAM